MRVLLLIIFTLCFTPVKAAEELPNETVQEQFSSKELLSKAKSLRKTDHNASLKLALKALSLSIENDNLRISAQTHTLLAKLTKRDNVEQSLEHFLQAALFYKKMDNKRDYIISSFNYIELLLEEGAYKKAKKVINEVLPIALSYKDEWPIALILISQAELHYKEKHFTFAVPAYIRATEYLSNNDNKTQKKLGETYKKIAQSYKRLKNKDKTALFYKKTLAVYTALDDQKNMARTLNTLAEAERYLGNLVLALDYSTRGLAIHKHIDDPEGNVKALIGAGIIYRQIGRYETSLKHVYEAHLYYKKINDVNGIVNSSNQLGFIYTRLKQFEQARSFYQLSIDLSERTGEVEQSSLASALREMAVIDLDAGNYESAMQMAKKAHKIYQKQKDKLKGSITARVIANIYRDQKKDKEAIAYYKESLRYAMKSGNKSYQVKAQVALAGMLVGKDTDEAITRLKISLALSAKIDNKVETLYAYRKFRQAEKLRGNIADSLYYAEQEIKLTEMIQKEKDDNELILAKANLHSYKMEIELATLREKTKLDQLELAKKNNEIALSEQTRIINELKLTKNQYTNFMLVMLLAVSMLSLIFLYRRFYVSKKRNKELDHLAARDPLTNCYNRRGLYVRMDRDFENPELLNDYCIIIVDIDHFKSVNDTYGHSVGDSVICNVANILQSCVRKDDIVVRFGGEEFCVVLYNIPHGQSLHIAETMRNKVESDLTDDVSVTCSFGLSSMKFNAKSPAELINQADLALYQSKTLGRNQVTVWSEELEKGRK